MSINCYFGCKNDCATRSNCGKFLMQCITFHTKNACRSLNGIYIYISLSLIALTLPSAPTATPGSSSVSVMGNLKRTFVPMGRVASSSESTSPSVSELSVGSRGGCVSGGGGGGA